MSNAADPEAPESKGEDASQAAPVIMGRPFEWAVKQFEGDPVTRTIVYCERLLHILQLDKKSDGEAEQKGSDPEKNENDEHSRLLYACEKLCSVWKKRNKDSEIALKGLNAILELCLIQCPEQNALFAFLIEYLGFNSIAYWRNIVPIIFDSDLSLGTQYRDALLFSLALHDVNNNKSRLKLVHQTGIGESREFYAAVPGVRQSMLGEHAKRFCEKYSHLVTARSRCSSRISSRHASSENLLTADTDGAGIGEGSEDASETTGATHHKQRVINVSNAPPVSLKRNDSGSWEIKQGSGGLVSCVDPVMSVDNSNIWLANLGINVTDDQNNDQREVFSTNSLGLPLIKQTRAGDVFHVLESSEKKVEELTPSQKDVERDMSLLSVLHDYNKTNYQLNPVFVREDDYTAYYGGISNGLLWPALHNLPDYIVKEYDDPKILNAHWCAYVRVNYQFALNAVRNSRPQDFIWIHDYHLMLCGQLMRSLDVNLEMGFFLHIPFQPPDNFLTKYKAAAEGIIRGILRFTKVGFQTHRDRQKYIELVRKVVSRARISYEPGIDIYTISNEGCICSLGVFPVSIKNEDFLSIAQDPQTIIASQDIYKKVMANSEEGGTLFFSVERFDYTKGIIEKLRAWRRYFEKYPERKGKDVLMQIAVTNRRGVESYRVYQDNAMGIAEQINREITCEKNPDWKPIVFQTDGLPRSQLIAHYLAMDVGVVTPAKDGMNLVAKEMLVCNPSASLILSTGAGTEVQLGLAGFHGEKGNFYHRVEEISNSEAFSDSFYAAATEDREVRKAHSEQISSFFMEHGIAEWSSAFLDPGWTHEVIRPSEVTQLADFYMLMSKTAQVRRQIVDAVLKGMPIRPHLGLSLQNAMNALERSCEPDSKNLVLQTNAPAEDADGANLTAKFEISDELSELEKDLAFLQFIQQDDIQNVERFIDTLGSFHPSGPSAFQEEVNGAYELLIKGDHFYYVFTDRDGTLKSYSCSYPTSVQPAYSAVIQAQFARRFAQFCAIVTTAPLVHIGILNMTTMPEGYYAYGASAGREWYFNPAMQFKDDSCSENDLMVLNQAFEKVEDLLENPEYRNFTWIGSGLQKHFGHITIASQDKNNSIPRRKSRELYEQICRIVKDVDQEGATLTVCKGDLDIKIFTKAKNEEEYESSSTGEFISPEKEEEKQRRRMSFLSKKLATNIFNKGHGIRLITQKMGFKLNEGNILVCGDSDTDLPMLEECLEAAPTRVYTIWVTTNKRLQELVITTLARYKNTNYVFVSCPMALLGAMGQATKRVLAINGNSVFSDDEDI